MKIVLYVLAAVGVVLIGLALYVFLFAARAFVSESQKSDRQSAEQSNATLTQFRPRAVRDRRLRSERRHSAGASLFPLVDSSGMVIEHDRRLYERRTSHERRHA